MTQTYQFGKTYRRKITEPPEGYMARTKESLGVAGGGAQDYDRAMTKIFPSDLSAHFMALMIWRYGHTEQGVLESKLNKTILLPIPQNLIDNTSAQYNTPEMGPLGGMLADVIAQKDAGTDILQQGWDRVKNYYKGAYATGQDIMAAEDPVAAGMEALNDFTDNDMIGQALTAPFRKGDNPIGVGLNKAFGSVPNPHITSIFRGIGLKTHNFTWKLSPGSEDETAKLAAIIHDLKRAMLPERHKIMLRFPDEVEIFLGGSMESHFLYPFKKAVIRNMSVNYVPDGTPSFFGTTGAPTAVTLTLDLLETAIHTREDYPYMMEPGIGWSWVSSASNRKWDENNNRPADGGE